MGTLRSAKFPTAPCLSAAVAALGKWWGAKPFVLTRAMVIVDNLRAQARIVVSVVVNRDASDDVLRKEYDAAIREIEEIESGLAEPSRLGPLTLDNEAAVASGRSNMDRETFMSAVERIREYIRAGDCFQALISRRIDLRDEDVAQPFVGRKRWTVRGEIRRRSRACNVDVAA